MKQVKLKFRCESVLNHELQQTVDLRAVVSGSEENRTISEFTPNGHLTFIVTSKAPAFNAFTPGKEYYITLDEVEVAAVAE